MVGQALKHIADIDDERSFRRCDINPSAFAVEQLQAGFLGAQQQSDKIDIFMRSGADGSLRIACEWRIMEEA